ncbi:MAG: hypothetical protein VX265_09540 [Myxococcota bacterium]|nr:hypothetical protein [Myxococcota bacterium]MEC8423758.1 hypothetical protein [Myxococcota bacterium]
MRIFWHSVGVSVLGAALLTARPAVAGEQREGAGLPAPAVTGLLQVWGTVYDQDENPLTDPASYGDPEDDPGFKIRRARIGLAGDQGGARYDLTFGFSSGFDAIGGLPDEDIQLISASGGLEAAEGLWVDAGVVKVPTSRSFLMSAGDLALGDRPVGSNALVPAREVGVTVDGTVGEGQGLRGRGRLGVFNGNGSLFGDDNLGKMVAARLEGLYGPGDTYRTFGSVEGVTIGVAGDVVYSSDLVTTNAHFGGDLMVRVAGLALLVEGHLSTITPQNTDLDLPGTLGETPRLGTVAQVGYSVGRWEPVARFSTFDDHREFDDNGDIAIGEGGVVWHGKGDAIRAGALYVARLELEGQPAQNDSARLWLQMKL